MRPMTTLELIQARYAVDSVKHTFIGKLKANHESLNVLEATLKKACEDLHAQDPAFPRMDWHFTPEMAKDWWGNEIMNGHIGARPIRINGEEVEPWLQG
jgi:hypothetical protein